MTLIEVLVVIGILSMLAVMLLPALAQARGKVNRFDCINRLKQWNVAFRSFAEDNDGWIARECYEPLGEVTINNWSQVKGRLRPDGTSDSQDVWYNALPAHLGLPSTTTYAAPPDRREFFDCRKLIHCPSARFPGHAFRPTYQFPLFSLAMNSQLIRSGPSVRFGALEERDPSRTVTFLDNLLEGEAKVHPAQETTHLGQPGAYANRFGARHDGGGNLAFVDGHVTWFTGRKVVETRKDSPLLGGPILPPNDIVWEIYPW
jgi:prepilin-type processing-associated H-X9-DG protein